MPISFSFNLPNVFFFVAKLWKTRKKKNYFNTDIHPISMIRQLLSFLKTKFTKNATFSLLPSNEKLVNFWLITMKPSDKIGKIVRKRLKCINKGWRSKFLLLTSIDVIQHILYKTNQYLIIIISISCQYISVHTLEQIKFSIWRLLAVHCRLNSLYIKQNGSCSRSYTFFTMHSKLFQKKNLQYSNLSSSGTKYLSKK